MTSRLTIVAQVVCLAIISIVIFSGISLADIPLPPPPPGGLPTPTPQPGGNGSPQPPYSAPSFQSYTEPLLSSDGSVIGNLSGIDFFTVRLLAGKNATVDGRICSFTLTGDLDQKPTDATMDIILSDSGVLPGGMNSVQTIVAANVSDISRYGWPFKAGTLKVTFTVPASSLARIRDGTYYYLVRYDGTGFQIVNATVAVGGDLVTFQASPAAETGTFTIVAVSPFAPLPTPTPTPGPTAAPELVTEQTVLSPGLASWAIAIASGAILGAVVMFLLKRRY